jgi:hypothetical protein
MAGKPKDRGSDKALSLRLPHDLHDRLAQAAGDHSVSEEIRQRLEASFVPEQRVADPQTQELLDAIANVARTVGSFYAPWHENPYALAIVRSAVATLLAAMGPKGRPVFQPTPNNRGWSDLLFDPKDPPETAGRMLAMSALTDMRRGKP